MRHYERKKKTHSGTRCHKTLPSWVLLTYCHLQSRLWVYCYSNQAEWVQFVACRHCNMHILTKNSEIASHVPLSCLGWWFTLWCRASLGKVHLQTTVPVGKNGNRHWGTFIQLCQLWAHLKWCQLWCQGGSSLGFPLQDDVQFTDIKRNTHDKYSHL